MINIFIKFFIRYFIWLTKIFIKFLRYFYHFEMSTEILPEYINVLQHRQIEKQINSQSFIEASQINDSNSISEPNASKLAVEVFQENQRLIAQIEQMKQNYSNEIRKLRDEYDSRLLKISENEEKYISLLREKEEIIRDLKQQIMQTDKDSLIHQQNEQIQKLNIQYENAIDSRCFQVEKLQAALDKVEELTKENQVLKNQLNKTNLNNESSKNYISSTNISNGSPKKSFYPSNVQSPYKNPNLTSTQITSNVDSFSSFVSNRNEIFNTKASTPPNIRYGRKRAPPNHPALKEQIPYYLNQKENEEKVPETQVSSFNFTLNELKTTLTALQNEKNDIQKRLSKAAPVENEKYFAGQLMQKENDEKRLDEIDRMIGRIRLELRQMGKL